MHKLPLFFTLLFFSCQHPQENKTSAPNPPAPPATLTIAGRPLKTIALDTLQPPLVVTVPDKSGGFYSKINSKGEVRQIKLEAPAHQTLPVLQNAKDEPILDPSGKPYLLGDGGKANFTNFSTDDGLALDAVGCAVMDRRGNLWFGTGGGGVSRYDGKSFTNFTTAQGLAFNIVYCMMEDRHGNLWFGTYGSGASCYNGYGFTNYTTEQGLGSNIVYSIVEDKNGHLWFGTDGGGVSRYDGKSFTNFTTDQGLVNNKIVSILEDRQGHLWFGSFGGGISRYDGASFTTFTTADGLGANHVMSMLEDRNGILWFGLDAGGVSRYDGTGFTNFSTADGLANPNVRAILEDHNGTLWFGTDGGGVSRYDGKSFTSFTTTQGLASNFIFCMLEDRHGSLWFGANGGGLSRYDGRAVSSFTTAEGLANNQVLSIFEDSRGHFWFGTNGGGVSRYDGRSFTNFTLAQGLTNNNVCGIIEDQHGHLWFSTIGGGVSRYDGKSFTSYSRRQGLANNQVFSLLEDSRGHLWFGAFGGEVSRFDGATFTQFPAAPGQAENINVWSILEDRNGHLWFGTGGGGASRYDGQTITYFTTAQGLAHNHIYSILEDQQGQLWFGTGGGGVSRYDGKTFTSFTTAQGLSDDVVTDILEDKLGNIIFGTNLGLTFLPAAAATLPFSEVKTQLEYYNNPSGYPIKDINPNALFCDSKGMIWAGTGSDKTGLVRFDHASLQKSNRAPDVVIESVQLHEERLSWFDLQTKGLRKHQQDSATALLQSFLAYGKPLTAADNRDIQLRFGLVDFDSVARFYPVPANLVLPYEHNHISFEFAAIETAKPQLIRYQYLLEGYDHDWSPATSKTSASFGNINEGRYTFKLRAQGADGVWSAPITYAFQVLPPWYRSWWAYLTYVLFSLAALRFFSKWRERNLRAEKEKLERTVEERTALVEKQKAELIQKNIIVEKEKKRSDDLLLNILPEEVAEELKTKGSAAAKQFDEVTVLFTDFENFTPIAAQMTPKALVEEIDACYKAFDEITEKYGIEKIKTIGDSYMCAGGLPVVNSTHAVDVVNAGLEIQQFIKNRVAARTAAGMPAFQIRIGIHSGPVVAGIVGIKKFAYDIWGDTVNTASRMESSGEAGQVNISGATFEQVKDHFTCSYRGKIQPKGKEAVDMYFVKIPGD